VRMPVILLSPSLCAGKTGISCVGAQREDASDRGIKQVALVVVLFHSVSGPAPW
jgi:hypothetical protein